MELYTTGTGQSIRVHDEAMCTAPCPIHKPSDHAMRSFPTHWRDDRGLMERICPCGVGHPDPDTIEFYRRHYGEEVARTIGIHGCCGLHCGPYAKEEP